MGYIDVNILSTISTIAFIKMSLLGKQGKVYTTSLCDQSIYQFIYFATSCESTIILKISVEIKSKINASRQDRLALEMQAMGMLHVKYNRDY